MKIKITDPILLIIMVFLFYFGFSIGRSWPSDDPVTQHEINMLQHVEDMLVDAFVPDSIKQETRDASYTSMYAEPDGNDYWASRGTIHRNNEYIKGCKPCMYIDSLLQSRQLALQQK
jgi:hypothetical protein